MFRNPVFSLLLGGSLILVAGCSSEKSMTAMDYYDEANVAFNLHDFESARTLAEQGLEKALQDHGEGSYEHALLVAAMATVHSFQGDEDKALALYEKSIAMHEKNEMTHLSEAGNIYAVLAGIYGHKQNLEKAEENFKKSIESFEQATDDDPRWLPQGLTELAFFYMNQGRDRDAIPLLQKAVKGLEAMEQKDFVIIGRSHYDLAVVYENTRQFELAGQHFEVSLGYFQKSLGPQHPDTVNAMINLSINYSLVGRIQEARDLIQKAYEIKVSQLGKRHPNSLDVLNMLSIAEERLGNQALAIQHLEEVIRFTEEDLGAENSTVIGLKGELERLKRGDPSSEVPQPTAA